MILASQYPHNRYIPCPLDPVAVDRFERSQLRTAAHYFLGQLHHFNAATLCAAALTIEQKETLLPHLQSLINCGLAPKLAENILWSRSHDVKSLTLAEGAFRAIAAFAEDARIADAGRIHVALYYIGRTLKAAADVKYNPNQPRVPRGNPRGGQWTDAGGGGGGGGGGGAGRSRNAPPSTRIPPLPGHKPPAPPKKPPHPHADSPYYDPATGIYDPPVRPVGNPVTDAMIVVGGARVLKPAAEAVVSGVTAVRNAVRLRGYLSEARQIPKGVKEVSKGTEHLTTGQRQSLKDFTKKHSKFRENIDITNYSDGRAIYSVKQPAKNIPNSYTVWDKQVDAAGKVVQTTKTTVGPDGELIHIKKY